MDKLIITVAGVGAETTKDAQPGLPVTAAEIGADAARCREAGAAMYHLHVRDAEANPTQAKEVFAAAIEAIRERTDIIIQTSTGGAMGMTADERLQPLELGPEMASLTTGTANFGDDVFFNDAALMSEFYQRMQKQGRPARVRDLRGRPDRQRAQAGQEVRPGRPAAALGLRAGRAGQHERRAAQPRCSWSTASPRGRPGPAPASAAGTCR